MSAPAELDDVRKRFGRLQALDGLSLELRPGEVVALLGPNGAGKTTALSLLLGLRRPDSGRARLFGRDPREPAARRRVGAMPQDVGFPQTLRVRELLALARAHYDEPAPLDELLDRFDVRELERRQAGGLSGGERRKVAVAMAFAGRPSLVVLDEPTTGLDPHTRRALWHVIREHPANGGAVLMSTHYLEEAEQLAHRVLVLNDGRLVTEGAPAELRAALGRTLIRLRAASLPRLPAGTGIERDGEVVTLYVADVDAAVHALVDGGTTFVDLEVRPATLEEAFLAATRKDT